MASLRSRTLRASQAGSPTRTPPRPILVVLAQSAFSPRRAAEVTYRTVNGNGRDRSRGGRRVKTSSQNPRPLGLGGFRPLARGATTITPVAVYLGLAIAGWGGIAPFFAHPALTALAIATAVLTGVAFFTEGNLSSGEREDRSNRWVIAALGILGLLVAYLPARTDRTAFWTLDGDTIRWLGVVLFVAGTLLRLWPVFVLGRRFSGYVAIQPGHTLVTTGIYGVIRHPSYLGLLIGTLGWALAFRSTVGIVLTTLMLVPIVARIRAEERFLYAHFGAQYNVYRSRTSRLIPGLY